MLLPAHIQAMLKDDRCDCSKQTAASVTIVVDNARSHTTQVVARADSVPPSSRRRDQKMNPKRRLIQKKKSPPPTCFTVEEEPPSTFSRWEREPLSSLAKGKSQDVYRRDRAPVLKNRRLSSTNMPALPRRARLSPAAA